MRWRVRKRPAAAARPERSGLPPCKGGQIILATAPRPRPQRTLPQPPPVGGYTGLGSAESMGPPPKVRPAPRRPA